MFGQHLLDCFAICLVAQGDHKLANDDDDDVDGDDVDGGDVDEDLDEEGGARQVVEVVEVVNFEITVA